MKSFRGVVRICSHEEKRDRDREVDVERPFWGTEIPWGGGGERNQKFYRLGGRFRPGKVSDPGIIVGFGKGSMWGLRFLAAGQGIYTPRRGGNSV